MEDKVSQHTCMLIHDLPSLEGIQVSEHSTHIQYSDSIWKGKTRQKHKAVSVSVWHLLATAQASEGILDKDGWDHFQ